VFVGNCKIRVISEGLAATRTLERVTTYLTSLTTRIRNLSYQRYSTRKYEIDFPVFGISLRKVDSNLFTVYNSVK